MSLSNNNLQPSLCYAEYTTINVRICMLESYSCWTRLSGEKVFLPILFILVPVIYLKKFHCYLNCCYISCYVVLTRHSNYWLLIRPVCHKIIEITSVTRAYLIVSRKTTVVMWLLSYICLSLELSLNMLSGKEDTPRLNSLIVTNFFKPWNASGWIVKFCPAFGKYCIRLKTLNILVIP